MKKNTSIKENTMKKMLFYSAILSLLMIACGPKAKPETVYVAPEVKDKGELIFFPPGAQGRVRIETKPFGTGKEFIQILAPARVVATVSHSVSSGGRIVLFESADLNTAYSMYKQARNASSRAHKNLKRVKDMYSMQVATERDIIEAETESGNSGAQVAESEGKLRAAGVNPSDLNNYGSNIVWMIADISESRLDATKAGRNVNIIFNSFPDKKMKGKVQAVGDNVDPATRTVKVRVIFPNEKGKFKPGMFAKVEFIDDERAPLVLPFTSIFTIEGENFVFVEEMKDAFRKKPVVIGNSNADYVEILQGLKKGDSVVTEGVMLLKGLSVGF
jgi:cobalt-zinc-cadmium efflux system membrane fusion protein